jgi:hypothetical protein
MAKNEYVLYKKEGYAFHAVYFSMSGQILVLA